MKLLPLIFSILVALVASGQSTTSFVTTWKTDNPGTSSNTQITIPASGSGYNYNVTWEEIGNPSNTGSSSGNTVSITIDLPSSGIYRVEISGDYPAIAFNNSGDKEKILSVEQWGGNKWTTMRSAFHGCKNLRINASDTPDLSNVTDMSRMFENCSTLNDDISGWNTSNVTNMSSMFFGAIAFNQPIGSWDVSKVTDMGGMFHSGDFEKKAAFNQPLNSWNVSNVTDMSTMFASCSFNQAIGSWDVSNVTNMSFMFASANSFNQDISSWDVGKVTEMNAIFSEATDFNQPIGNWNVSSVTNMSFMFNADSAFNQNLGSWDVSQVSNMSSMFSRSGMSSTTYDSTLLGWASLPTLKSQVNVGAQGVIYCDTLSRNKLIGLWLWTFSEDFRGGALTLDLDSLPAINAKCQLDTLIPPSATNACGEKIFATTNQSFPISTSTTVFWQFVDQAGFGTVQTQEVNASTRTFIEPDIDPLPELVGVCSIDTIMSPPTAKVCRGSADSTIIATTTTAFPILANELSEIIWTYRDGNRSLNRVQSISWQDNAPAPDNAELSTISADCGIDFIEPPTATDDCDGAIEGSTELTFPIAEGSVESITWSFTDNSGNTSTQVQQITWEECVLSANGPTENSYSIYPVPASEKLTITGPVSNNLKYSIFNSAGQQFENSTRLWDSAIDISKLPKGLFFLEIRSGLEVETLRFVKD